MGAELSVGRVASRCGVSVSTLHFYERKGLIQSWRNAGNQRRYSRDVIRRVSLIKVGQKLGVSLSELQKMFASLPASRAAEQADWQKLAQLWQVRLREQISQMQRLDELLTGCIGCGCLSMNACPLHNKNDQAEQYGSGAVYIECDGVGKGP